MFALGSMKDPFYFSDYPGPAFQKLPGSKIIHDPRLVAGDRNCNMIIVGQSQATNVTAATIYTPVNAAKVDNLSIHDGGVYRAVDPLLGCSGLNGNYATRLGDKMIAGGFADRSMLTPVAIDGTSSEQWAPGGILHDRLLAACNRNRAHGWPQPIFIWQQGEQDAALGTSRDVYGARLKAIIASVRGEGFSGNWFIGKSTYLSGVTSPTIRAAYDDVVNGTNILPGADTDSIPAEYRFDGTHFNDVGSDMAASLWRDAITSRMTF